MRIGRRAVVTMEVGYLRGVGLSVGDGSPHVLKKRQANGVQAAATSSASSDACQPCSNGDALHRLVSPCCLLGQGFAPQSVDRAGRAPWLKPQGGHDVGLQVFNSYTNEKEPFVPMEGKKIRWYTCGPTVYDATHMGHARTFLSFDILRRIMAHYFGYDVRYQVNITDIDDKIILRSRQRNLLKDFCGEAAKMDLAKVRGIVEEAVAFAGNKLAKKAPQEPEVPSAPATDKEKQDYERKKQEYETLKQEHGLKLSQHAELVVKVKAAADSKDALLDVSKDALMAKLDKEKGHTVSDHSIFDAHARHYENEYLEDMDALGIMRPDVMTRISEYMDGRVQRYIEKLEDLGVAYESNGSVYFSIDEFTSKGYNYRKLVPATNASEAEMAEGEGALAAEDSEKRNNNDFAVWKKSKPGEPSWTSRWGQGRPGWHIECSVMACDIHNEFLDVHSGGEDLRFPHHDNEMAQSEAYLGRPQWTNYWFHAGHLSIAGLKMSKSLKNFITIRQAMVVHSARQLRLMFLMQQWDKGMNYSDQAIEMARAEERKFKHFLGRLKFQLRKATAAGEAGDRERSLSETVKASDAAIGAALRDNFNTAKAIDVLSKLVAESYGCLDETTIAVLAPVQEVAELLERILGVFGVEGLAPKRDNEAALSAALDAFASLRQEVRQLAKAKAVSAPDVQAAVSAAGTAVSQAKVAGLIDCAAAFEVFCTDIQKCLGSVTKRLAAELLQRCDDVRDKDFVALGVRLEDRLEDFLWMFDDPQVMARELKEQADKKIAAEQAKLANKLKLKQQELEAAVKAAVRPEDFFRTGPEADKYSAFDASGLPSKLAGGEEVSKSLAKQLTKMHSKQSKDFDKIQKQAGANGLDAFLDQLRQEVRDLEASVNHQ